MRTTTLAVLLLFVSIVTSADTYSVTGLAQFNLQNVSENFETSFVFDTNQEAPVLPVETKSTGTFTDFSYLETIVEPPTPNFQSGAILIWLDSLGNEIKMDLPYSWADIQASDFSFTCNVDCPQSAQWLVTGASPGSQASILLNTPEPNTLWLLGSGVLGLMAWKYRN